MSTTPSHTQPLAQLYAQEIQPILGGLEERRQRAHTRALVSLAIIVPVTVVLVLLLIRWVEFLAVLVVMLAIGAWFAANNALQAEYRRYFKAEVIARLARLVDPSLTYAAGGGVGRGQFEASGIYRHRIDRYRAEDLFEGQVGATFFRFSEVHAEYKTTTTDSKGRRKTHWHTIFRGVFFIADFNKHFQGQTFVLPDVAESALGGLGRMLQGWGSKMDGRPGELVRLEDPAFERLFVASSTDQVEARYILSTSLMQRLVGFRNEVNAPVALSFVNAQIYIAISTSKNHFEPPSIWGGAALLDQDEVAAYFKDVRLAEQIIEDLNLNLRIWSKQ